MTFRGLHAAEIPSVPRLTQLAVIPAAGCCGKPNKFDTPELPSFPRFSGQFHYPEAHHGRPATTPAAHHGRSRRRAETQAAHPREYALAGHRSSVPQARRACLLPSCRSQEMVRTIAPAIVLGAEAVRLRAIVGTVIAIALLLVPVVSAPTPLLVWNASPSVPIGLYAVTRTWPRAGDLALVRLPANVAVLAARGAYLPRSAFLLKPVTAVPGDRICRVSDRIFVNGHFMALARWADRLGRSLPAWSGCRTLAAGELFLLANDPDSFDSRYFGPLAQQHIIGRSFLIW